MRGFNDYKWYVYIEDDGHWPVPYFGNNKREARRAATRSFRERFGVSRLPNGAVVVCLHPQNA